MEALAGTETIRGLAEQHEVSRKFVVPLPAGCQGRTGPGGGLLTSVIRSCLQRNIDLIDFLTQSLTSPSPHLVPICQQKPVAAM